MSIDFPFIVTDIQERLTEHGIERTDAQVDRAVYAAWVDECDELGAAFDLDGLVSRQPDAWAEMLYRTGGVYDRLEVDAEGDETLTILSDRLTLGAAS